MKKYLKNTLSALLIVILLLTSYLPIFAVGQTSYSTSSNSGQRDVVCTTLEGTGAEDYYTGMYTYDNLSGMSSTQLFNSLRSLMTDTHSYISSYANCRDYAVKTDCENNDGRIVMIYTSHSGTKGDYNNGQGWNREHVWPQSLGGDNTNGGGADLHHIRPSESKTNSTRGNKKYGNVTNGSTATGNLSGDVGGTYAGNLFEPLDNVKGDVARICLYVYVRWGSDWGASNITSVFQSVDVLLEWCALDPVDTWEMGRNEVVEDIQGNRNVFIDYPELAWLIFGREVPSNMTTPSGEASDGTQGGGNQGGNDNENQGGNQGGNDNENQGGNQGGNDNENQGGNQGGTTVPEVCTHSTTEVRGAVEATCQADGYSGDVYCKKCGELISEGEQIPSDGKHKLGEWVPSSDGMSFVNHCTVCGLRVDMTVDSIIATIDTDAEKILILLTLGSSGSSVLEALSK